MACCVLHNMLLEEVPPPDLPNDDELDDISLNEFGLEEEASTESDSEETSEDLNERVLGLRRQRKIMDHFQDL